MHLKVLCVVLRRRHREDVVFSSRLPSGPCPVCLSRVSSFELSLFVFVFVCAGCRCPLMKPTAAMRSSANASSYAIRQWVQVIDTSLRHKRTYTDTQRHTHRNTHRQTNTHANTQTYTITDTNTHILRHTHKGTQTHTRPGTRERESPDNCGLFVSDRYSFVYVAVYKVLC